MMPDYPLESTLDFKFTTRSFSTGAPTQLAGTPVVDIYEDNSVTQITGAETLTVDFDSVTGLNNLRVAATAANGFESGKSYHAVITTGTVGGVSVVGEVVAQFSIERSPALRPTTAGRTLDVTATGAAGIDWGNVENQGTTVDLSATDINLVDTTTTNTDMRGTDSALLAASAPSNWSSFAIDGSGRIDVGAWLGTAVTVSGGLPNANVAGWREVNPLVGATSGFPVVDSQAISDATSAADAVQSNIANLDATVSSRSTITTAEVNAEVDTALVDIHLDHLLAADYDPASKPGTATALLNELVEDDGGVSRFTVNALENGPGGAGGLTAADVLAQAQLAIVNSGVVNTSVPTNWSSFSIDGSGRVDVGSWLGTAVTVSGGLPNANVAGWLQTQPAVGATSGFPVVDTQAVSDDTTAADNLELDYDGTGFNKANSTIGTTTTNTDMRGTDSALLAASAPSNWSSFSIDGSGRVDVGAWLGTAVTVSGGLPNANVAGWREVNPTVGGTSNLPVVDAQAISDATSAADAVEANIANLDAAVSSVGGISAADVLAQAQLAILNSGVLGPVSAPTNFDVLAIDGSGRVDVGSWIGTAVTVSGGLPNTNVAGWDETSVSVGATSTFPVVDAQAISDDTTAADVLEALTEGAVLAQVNDASATTTAFAADQFTEATDDHFNGRLITFITGNLAGQQTDITDYDASGHAQGNQAFVVTALTEAPANDDWFVIT